MTGPVVLASKLQPPTSRPDAVARPQLVAALDARRDGALSVIVAPTGWGKSQLVAQWIDGQHSPVAYVGLDRADNDPTRCWAHILAAVGRAAGLDPAPLATALRAPALPVLSEIVEPLVAQLDGVELRVVLEDFHLITSPAVIESVEALVDLAPPKVSVLIVTRTEPSLHLPRRRVSGSLNEIRLDDLRMDVALAGDVISDAIGYALDPDLVRQLVNLTEGWAAGLYLAGLSLRAAVDPRAFVESFAGDDHLISDYLSSEVLAGLSDEDRRFLLGTAVLSELEPGLCDELLGRSDSAAALDRLSRVNLFLIPIDQAGRTFRYHQLFSDWLQLEVDRIDPTALRVAHTRVAEIHAARGEHLLAVDHALSAGAADLAFQLVGSSGISLIDAGHHSTVARWCSQLPATDDPDQMADLAGMRAWLGIIDGDVDEVERQCGAAQRVLNGKPWESRFGLGRPGELDVLRSYAYLLGGSFHASVSAAELARKGGMSRRTEVALGYVEAAVGYWLGEPDMAAFESARSLSQEMHDPYAVLLADAYLALIALDSFDTHTAEPLIQAAFDTAREAGLESFGYAAVCHLARARLRILVGDGSGAVEDALRATDLAQRRNDLPIGCLAGMVVAEARHGLGDPAASESLQPVTADIVTLPDPGILEARLVVTERQLRLPVRARSARLSAPIEALTDREMRLLRLLPGTLSQRELGDALYVSFNTVKTYNRQIYRKLGVSSRDGAVAAAREFGLL